MTGQGKQAIDLALAESFKELASRHPIEKITIKDITDKAGVIRPTFYNHFQDKYSLVFRLCGILTVNRRTDKCEWRAI